MKVEVVTMVRYYADGFTPSLHHSGEIADIPQPFVDTFLEAGDVLPLNKLETKPLKANIEVKGNNKAKRRARKPNRA